MTAEISDVTRPSSTRTGTYRRSAPFVLGALVLGALGGFAIAAERRPRAAAAVEPAAPLSLDDWLARAGAWGGTPDAADRALRDDLSRALAARPTMRAQVLERYAREPDRHRRTVLRELLVSVPGADLARAARGLADREDAVQRAAGFELLARLGPSKETYALARPRVFGESDPAALAGALAAFAPVGKPSNAEIREVVPRLVELSDHADPAPRALAIQRLADWDLGGTRATPIVCEALGDRDRLVRQAAVGAVMIGALHDASLTPGLLRLVAQRDEELAIRGAALQALERFPLTDDEHATYMAARADLERLAGTP